MLFDVFKMILDLILFWLLNNQNRAGTKSKVFLWFFEEYLKLGLWQEFFYRDVSYIVFQYRTIFVLTLL